MPTVCPASRKNLTINGNSDEWDSLLLATDNKKTQFTFQFMIFVEFRFKQRNPKMSSWVHCVDNNILANCPNSWWMICLRCFPQMKPKLPTLRVDYILRFFVWNVFSSQREKMFACHIDSLSAKSYFRHKWKHFLNFS